MVASNGSWCYNNSSQEGNQISFPSSSWRGSNHIWYYKISLLKKGNNFFFFEESSCMCNLKLEKMLHNLTRKIFFKWLEISDYAGEWWKQQIFAVYNKAIFTGADPNVSDAYTINGQPGVLYPCSKPGQRFLKFYMNTMFIKFIFYQMLLRLTLLNRMKREEDWRVPVRG